ncbi:MAG: hypothetical protein V6Z89_14385 [Desulfobacter sp.]
MAICELNKETVFSGIALLLIGLSIYFGYLEKNMAMGASIISGLSFLCFGHLNRISEFRASASGIEAKTHKLEDTVEHAKGVIEELRKLAKAV